MTQFSIQIRFPHAADNFAQAICSLKNNIRSHLPSVTARIINAYFKIER